MLNLLLGRSGLQVSALALGTMNLGGVTGRQESFDIINLSIAAGINLIDYADVYNEGKTKSRQRYWARAAWPSLTIYYSVLS